MHSMGGKIARTQNTWVDRVSVQKSKAAYLGHDVAPSLAISMRRIIDGHSQLRAYKLSVDIRMRSMGGKIARTKNTWVDRDSVQKSKASYLGHDVAPSLAISMRRIIDGHA